MQPIPPNSRNAIYSICVVTVSENITNGHKNSRNSTNPKIYQFAVIHGSSGRTCDIPIKNAYECIRIDPNRFRFSYDVSECITNVLRTSSVVRGENF